MHDTKRGSHIIGLLLKVCMKTSAFPVRLLIAEGMPLSRIPIELEIGIIKPHEDEDYKRNCHGNVCFDLMLMVLPTAIVDEDLLRGGIASQDEN